MADSKLRLQIQTSLDNAGLKATKEQLDSLEKSLTKLNTSSGGGNGGGFSGLPNKLQKMPGLLGDITGQFGKIGASLGVAYTAYKTFEKGVEGGKKIFEQFGDGAGYSLESIGNGFSTLGTKMWGSIEKFFTGTNAEEAAKQAMEVAKKNEETMVKSAEDATKKKMELMKKEQDEHKKVIDKIQQETNAYIRQAQSLGGLKSSLGNSKALMLERTKIEEQRKYDAMGRSDVADQIGLAYDVEIQRVKNESADQQNEIEQRKAEKDWKQAVEKAKVQRRRTNELKVKMNTVEQQMKALKKTKLRGANLKAYAGLKKQYDTLSEQYKDSLDAENPLVDTANEKLAKLQEVEQVGANTRFANQTALEQAMINFDNFETLNGNVGNFSFDKKWLESLGNMQDEWKYMEETAKNTASLADKLDELLQAR